MKRTYLFPTFLICFIFALGIFFFMRGRSFDLPHVLILPIQKKIFVMRNNNLSAADKLRQENEQLRVQLAQMNLLIKENKALRDQFQFDNNQLLITNNHLLPASIVSMPDFILGLTKPSFCIIDKGGKQRVYAGQPVVINNVLVGTVIKTTDNFSSVLFTFSPKTSLSAKTSHTNAIGILKGGEDLMTFENVVLSDSLSVGDSVTTIGNLDINGKGIPSDFIVGTISSVEKNPSSLFQKATIKSFVDVTKLSTVFLVVSSE